MSPSLRISWGGLSLLLLIAIHGSDAFAQIDRIDGGKVEVRNAETVELVNDLLVGETGIGRLRLENGTRFITSQFGTFIIGRNAGGQGSVEIIGPDSWLQADRFDLGALGRGEMLISAGGRVTAFASASARQAGSTGLLRVEGPQ